MNAISVSLLSTTAYGALAMLWLLAGAADSYEHHTMAVFAEYVFHPLLISHALLVALCSPALAWDHDRYRAIAAAVLLALVPLPLWILVWLGGGVAFAVVVLAAMILCAVSLVLVALALTLRLRLPRGSVTLALTTLQVGGLSLLWLWRDGITAWCL